MGTVITVGREFGSGGREFARKLAEALGYEYFDKEILAEIAKHTDFSEAYIKSVLESKPHGLFPISMGYSFAGGIDHQLQQMQTIYTAQFDVINQMADKANCVVVGRCGDYILRNRNPFRIFVYGDMQARVQRCLTKHHSDEPVDAATMEKMIKKMDKGRAKYYNDYSGQEWGKKEYYDLCINTTGQDIDELVAWVASRFRK